MNAKLFCLIFVFTPNKNYDTIPIFKNYYKYIINQINFKKWKQLRAFLTENLMLFQMI